jgi:hypothetical protein
VTSLRASGNLHAENPTGAPTAGNFPLTVKLQTNGTRLAPNYHAEIDCGSAAHAVLTSDLTAGIVQIENFSLRDVAMIFPPEFLKTLSKAPELTDAPLTITLASGSATGKIDLNKGRFTGDVVLQKLSAGNGSAAHKIELRDADFSASIDTPLNAGAMREAIVSAASARFASAALDGASYTDATATFSLTSGSLVFKSLALTYSDGKIAGQLGYDLINQRIQAVNITVSHINGHALGQATGGKIDAEGAFSGAATFIVDDHGFPAGAFTLSADAPGRLFITDEQIAKLFAMGIPAGANMPLTNDDLGKIVVGQLKNYPFDSARITVTAPLGQPEVRLDIVRKPLEAGEPGFGIDVVIAGQTFKANVPIHFTGRAIAFPGQTIESLFGLLSGLVAPKKVK